MDTELLKKCEWLNAIGEQDFIKIINYLSNRLRKISEPGAPLRPMNNPEIKVSEVVTGWVIQCLHFPVVQMAPLSEKDRQLAKSLISDARNRYNGEKRRRSKDVKVSTLELTSNGQRALNEWKKRTNSSAGLLIESMLLDHVDLHKDIKSKNAKLMEKNNSLGDQISMLECKVKELNAQVMEKQEFVKNLQAQNESLLEKIRAVDAEVDSENEYHMSETNTAESSTSLEDVSFEAERKLEDGKIATELQAANYEVEDMGKRVSCLLTGDYSKRKRLCRTKGH
ncbi:MAG: hypothetical protein CMF16_02465 [Idiomarina sp.]|uniref:hypothetical protein n=2 Tax=Idiomarina TaxID=135575 RepID=UPI000C3D57B9|nr:MULTISPECIES: hypothetical protein [Idiomarina]MBF79680.1 hypothetical protein [Idiomarina sp.]MEC7643128.1 hypothetical protein [Pseudomonadota bacterium]